jgi:hypothetical protein
MSKLNEIRKKNMKKWTEEDRKFYEDFLHDVFLPTEETSSKEEEKITEKESPDQSSGNGHEEDRE